jgi:hypothetical protein
MFGIFKSKQKAADDDFKKSLSLFAEFFSARVQFLNSTQSKELAETVFSVYLQRNPDEVGQSVPEFYFDAMVGNIIEAMNQGALDKFTGLSMWKQANRFLLAHSDFNDRVVKACMDNWQSLLLHKGVDRMNFDMP